MKEFVRNTLQCSKGACAIKHFATQMYRTNRFKSRFAVQERGTVTFIVDIPKIQNLFCLSFKNLLNKVLYHTSKLYIEH